MRDPHHPGGTYRGSAGADHEKVRAFPLILVSNAGWDHDDIAGTQLNGLAALATQSHADPTRGDAEHLVRAAVIVMMRIDPILPGAGPTIAIEQRHAARRSIASGFERAAIDDQREPGIIWHPAIIGEPIVFDLRSSKCCSHAGRLPPTNVIRARVRL